MLIWTVADIIGVFVLSLFSLIWIIFVVIPELWNKFIKKVRKPLKGGDV